MVLKPLVALLSDWCGTCGVPRTDHCDVAAVLSRFVADEIALDGAICNRDVGTDTLKGKSDRLLGACVCPRAIRINRQRQRAGSLWANGLNRLSAIVVLPVLNSTAAAASAISQLPLTGQIISSPARHFVSTLYNIRLTSQGGTVTAAGALTVT
jgi:hypothetical protein